MTFLIAAPAVMQTAATELAGVRAALSQANGAAAGTTPEILAAGTDEVSAAIASVLGAHAQQYQALSARVESFHQQFVQVVSGGNGFKVGQNSPGVGGQGGIPFGAPGQDGMATP